MKLNTLNYYSEYLLKESQKEFGKRIHDVFLSVLNIFCSIVGKDNYVPRTIPSRDRKSGVFTYGFDFNDTSAITVTHDSIEKKGCIVIFVENDNTFSALKKKIEEKNFESFTQKTTNEINELFFLG